MNKLKKLVILLLLVLFSLNITGQSSEEFKERRKALQEKIGDSSIVLLFPKPAGKYSLLPTKYIPDANFYYISGYDKANAAVLLTKNFDFLAIKEGFRTGENKEEEYKKLKKETGFNSVNDFVYFKSFLSYQLKKTDIIYTDLSAVSIDSPLTEDLLFLKNLKDKFLNVGFKDISELLGDLRCIHSTAELALMRKAIAITDNAHIELMKSTEPGFYEYELEALCEYVFRRQGASGPAFSSIIGAGKNGIRLHYSINKDKLEKNDLVVIDIGARYKQYCADVTRTIPASGKFSEQQKQFYNIVLKTQLAAIAEVKPGVTFRTPDQVAKKVMQEELEKIGFIKKGDTAALRKYRKHSISHYLGLEPHDAGDWGAKLQPGMVITIEPGIYIPEYGFGIRIEDDVLVTEKGCEVLSKAPKTVAEIEKLMQEKGIGNQPIIH